MCLVFYHFFYHYLFWYSSLNFFILFFVRYSTVVRFPWGFIGIFFRERFGGVTQRLHSHFFFHFHTPMICAAPSFLLDIPFPMYLMKVACTFDWHVFGTKCTLQRKLNVALVMATCYLVGSHNFIQHVLITWLFVDFQF